MRRASSIALLLIAACAPSGAAAQRVELPEGRAAVERSERAPTSIERGAPDGDRALLGAAGATLGVAGGLVGSVVAGAIGYGVCANDPGCGYAPLYATIGAAPLTALLTIPVGVFLFGNLGGRGADLGWTLLGAWVGAVPGAVTLAIGASLGGGEREAREWAFGVGAGLAAVGVIGGSILAFELSSGHAAAARVSVGAGTVSVSGRF